VCLLIPVLAFIFAWQLGVSLLQMVLSPLFGSAPSGRSRTGTRSYVVMRNGRTSLYNVFRF